MVLRMQIIVAVVEPVGRKANWSANDSAGGGGGKDCWVKEMMNNCSLHDSGEDWCD